MRVTHSNDQYRLHRSCLPSCKAKSSGEAILLEDVLHKAVTKHDQCQEEAVTTEELILLSLCDPLGPAAS